MTRSSSAWQHFPGSFNAHNTRQLFFSDNKWGIPCLKHVPHSKTPNWLVPYRTRIRSNTHLADGAVHFFLDDYRFETVWRTPQKALSALQPYSILLTPDFSLYHDWPLALQLWNVYRNRWCGAFWQTHGFTVIPTVSWSSAESYPFCFTGIPKHSLVAISTLGINVTDPLQHGLFMAGFHAMIEAIQPSAVLCYGEAPAACHASAEIHTYPTRWTNIRAARQAALAS